MSKKNDDGISRREFFKKAGAVGVTAIGLSSGILKADTLRQPFKKQSPNDKVLIGMIGCSGMGSANMRSLMRFADVEIAALCDVDTNRITNDFRLVKEKYEKSPEVYKDYRKLLENKDIDAVVISTPDHWHALNLIHACEAGKDAYCEKPISHNIVEAIAMANCVRKHKSIVQVGTWQRSTKEFTDAISFIREDKLGKIVLCRAWINDGFQAGKNSPTDPPQGLDYDFWTGPAELIPYQPNRHHFNWRWFKNYGSGMTGDWGVHMIDIALLGMSESNDLVMPTEVSCFGGKWAFPDDDRTSEDTIEALYKFENPDFVLHWYVGRERVGKPGHGTEFVSADGKTLRVWRGGWIVLDPEGKELPKEAKEQVGDHYRNWLDCVKSRELPRAHLESLAQTTIVCHLANASLYAGDKVRWDKSKMDIVGNTGKSTLAYQREYRKPWVLPKF